MAAKLSDFFMIKLKYNYQSENLTNNLFLKVVPETDNVKNKFSTPVIFWLSHTFPYLEIRYSSNSLHSFKTPDKYYDCCPS
ncbi:hypothetical protein ASU31_21560 [Pedobacter ginsenosidimutans]|uniref:Uncharacterized protein n=1 Tax=Pedobacter ginsenosidimutans TaxID=687842 RepID=A0A0T5VKA3_9SPHI|nr:hypothetical protein ASU31_21560 [Pedobacter ginsenosidimutans]